MAYNPYDFASSEPRAATSNGRYHLSQAQMIPQQVYPDFSNLPDAWLSDGQLCPSISRGDTLEEPQDGDGEQRTRLTQAQWAALENSFQCTPKPKTGYKRMLAAKLHLELPRVNVSRNPTVWNSQIDAVDRIGIRTVGLK